MLSVLFFVGLFANCLAAPNYSFSGSIGGSGASFSSAGKGRITAIRVWEIQNQYIVGFQLRYDSIWTRVFGRRYGAVNEMSLFEGESITQVSGKYYSNYIYQVIFVSSKGRFLIVGQPYQFSFNFFPTYPDTELRILSGRFNGNGITSMGAHWGTGLKNSSST